MEIFPYLYYFTILPGYDVAPSSCHRVVGEIGMCLGFFSVIALLFHPAVMLTLFRQIFSVKKRVECHEGNEFSKANSIPPCPPTPTPVKPSAMKVNSSSGEGASDRAIPAFTSNQNCLRKQNVGDLNIENLIDDTLGTFFRSENLLDQLVEKI